MIIQEQSKTKVEPLLVLATELIQLRNVPNWTEAIITSNSNFGMMLTMLSYKTSSGEIKPLEIPTEFCERFNDFKKSFNQQSQNQINKILLKVKAGGVYELRME
ncbi:hypothetical protein I7Z51_002466 [Vibrio parahaemolyticus]|uniref:hypothetical protein n=1 Tax=Vibrio TaxID=662 RepID=UPI001A8CDB5B|nr:MULTISPECIES: hypothetical protein [Vibrio]EGQ7973544.1 hypothetical protein [Vibrio parahaemolyticus]MCR9809153.1 hypothetical protein [Vibrio parahaemolyticus]